MIEEISEKVWLFLNYDFKKMIKKYDYDKEHGDGPGQIAYGSCSKLDKGDLGAWDLFYGCFKADRNISLNDYILKMKKIIKVARDK